MSLRNLNFIKSLLSYRFIDKYIIIFGYFSFIHYFYENFLFTFISLMVVAAEIYQTDLPSIFFTKSERNKIENKLRFYRLLPAIVIFITMFGFMMIINGIISFDYVILII